MHPPVRTLRWSRVVATGAAALALAVGPTACSSDDGGDTAPSTPATSSVAASSSPAEHEHSADAPSAQSLQAILEQLTNPDVSVDQKVGTVVDGEQRREAFEQLNTKLQTYRGIAYQVGEVSARGDEATAQVAITSPTGHSAPPIEMTWQHVDDTWKLSDTDTCVLLGFAQLPCTPA